MHVKDLRKLGLRNNIALSNYNTLSIIEKQEYIEHLLRHKARDIKSSDHYTSNIDITN